MSGLEVAIIGLGTAVAKTACGVWLGDHRIAAAAGASLIDSTARRLTSARERRRFQRMWDQAAELVADQVEPLLAHEFRGLPGNERLAAVEAVRSTFAAAVLTEADLFEQNLDAGFLDRHLRRHDPDRVARAGLSTDATSLYDLLLRECCAYTIELARTLPGAGIAALTEVLRRERHVLDDMRTVLARLPVRRGLGDFSRDYRQLVANVLDQVEFFGATVTDASRRYPLSVAYLSLTVSGEFTIYRRDGPMLDGVHASAIESTTSTVRMEDALASTRRLFIRGQAGLGKTTLLQWIAVQSARGSFPEGLSDWNDTAPFFVALRRYADRDLPGPEQFVTEAGRHIAAEMPEGWAHAQLRSGRAIVLVDGVDELTEARRGEVRRWLRELVAAFPSARYVVTTRPAAAPADWLGHDDFDVAELEPMTAADVPVFVHRWHEAMRERCDTDDERAELSEYEEQLLDALTSQRHLRALAEYPLLCALLCALHRDRHGQLPGNRMELYEVALQMLLERRDRERRIERDDALTRTDQTLLLRDIAYWLIRNGWTSVSSGRLQERIAAKLAGMAQVNASPGEVYRRLLERSGLIREPVEGEVDFVHRTFQDYLGALEAVARDDIGALVANAWTDLWSDMVVMAAGHASTRQRVELIRGLLDRAEQEPMSKLRGARRLLAVACLETSPELPPDLRRDVQASAEKLLPPKSMAAAELLAKSGGAFAIDLLSRTDPVSAAEVAATIRTAADIGDPAAFPLLARFSKDPRKSVVRELLRTWSRFDPDEFARSVLRDCPLSHDEWLDIEDPRLIPALRHLTNLRRLGMMPSTGDPVELDFINDLPGLRRLRFPDAATLDPLAGSQLEWLWQLSDVPDRPPLSLAPLVDSPTLTYLLVSGRRVSDLASLRSLRHLDTLYLHHLGTVDALADLSTLHALSLLWVGGMSDLCDLEALRFLAQPAVIGATGCSALTDLSALGRWAKPVTGLHLDHCPAVDLATLRVAAGLEHLDLWGSGSLDLAPIADLPRLRSIVLGDGPLPDLHPLGDLPTLRMLYVFDVPELDLGPLAGRETLTVMVRRSTVVNGADRLGPGSRVVRK